MSHNSNHSVLEAVKNNLVIASWFKAGHMEFDALAERFVKVVKKMLISKLSFRQAGGAHASRASQAGPAASYISTSHLNVAF
jgi:hypothetical protein